MHITLWLTGEQGRIRVPLSNLHLFQSLLYAVLPRSEEHTSELQSLSHLVCRLLLEKKKKCLLKLKRLVSILPMTKSKK